MDSASSFIQRTRIWLRKRQQGATRWITAQLDDNKPKNTIAVLDGVRAIAIILVIVYHINRMTGDDLWTQSKYPLLSSISTSGSSGVVLFFVLSGFLLFMPFAKALLFESNLPSTLSFYLRRIFRIMPGYYLSLFVLILLTAPQYLHRYSLHNLLLFLTFFMDSSPRTFRQLNGPYWTLGIEWWFYMLLPWLCLGLYALVRRVPLKRRLPTLACCLLALIIYGLFIRDWGYYLQVYPTVTFLIPRSVLNIIMFFIFGVYGKYLEVFAIGMAISLCYIYTQYASPENQLKAILHRLSLWLFGTGIFLLLINAMWHFEHDYNFHGWSFFNPLVIDYFSFGDFTSAVGFGLCVMAILFGPRFLQRPFEWQPLRWIGLISYGLYIWHLPMLYYFNSEILPHLHVTNRYVSYGLVWLWLLVIVIPFAFILFVTVEKRWIATGNQLRIKLENVRLEKLKQKKVLAENFSTVPVATEKG
jgi:peptidoglycan/LPS O-acetylase OafA/YrhL